MIKRVQELTHLVGKEAARWKVPPFRRLKQRLPAPRRLSRRKFLTLPKPVAIESNLIARFIQRRKDLLHHHYGALVVFGRRKLAFACSIP